MIFFQKIITSAVVTTSTILSLLVSAEAASLSIGLNFTGATQAEAERRLLPPDTIGAVGENYIVQLTNGNYSVYDKSNGVRVQTSSLSQFWINASVTPQGDYPFDPRVVYDPFSQRWFAASVDNGGRGGDNNFLIAVSNSSNPTLGWKGFAIDSDPDNLRRADFPTLGFNRDGVYLAANVNPIEGRGGDFRTTVVAIPKENLLATSQGVTSLRESLFPNLSASQTGFTVQPVVDLDNTGLPFALLSGFNTPLGFFKRSNITGDINSPDIGTVGGFISVRPFNSPSKAEQPGSIDIDLSFDVSRLSSNLILQNGIIWGVQNVDNGGKSALRWFKIDASTNALLQDELISDPNLDFYFGSIAVNDFNDVVIGFNGSSETQYIGSYAVLGETVSNITNFGEPMLLKESNSSYALRRATLPENLASWGDYSATVIDPSDPLTFWTFQEIALAPNNWATQITQLKIIRDIPEPASVLGLLALGTFSVSSLLKRKV